MHDKPIALRGIWCDAVRQNHKPNSQKMLYVPERIRGQKMGYGMVDGIAKFQALKVTFHERA